MVKFSFPPLPTHPNPHPFSSVSHYNENEIIVMITKIISKKKNRRKRIKVEAKEILIHSETHIHRYRNLLITNNRKP